MKNKRLFAHLISKWNRLIPLLSVFFLLLLSGCEALDLILDDSQQTIEPSTEESLDIDYGIFTLTAKHSGKVLDVAGPDIGAGAQCVQEPLSGSTSQQWVIKSLGEGIHSISAMNSKGIILAVKEADAEGVAYVVLADWNNTDNQKWKIDRQSDGYCKITALHSGKVLDVKDEETADDAECIEWKWHSGSNQMWKLEEIQR